MVLKEWGEAQTLYRACLWRPLRATFALTKMGSYWYVWVFIGIYLSTTPWLRTLVGVTTGSPRKDSFVHVGLALLTAVAMWRLLEIAITREFKDIYDTHGIAQFRWWRRREYLRYALVLDGLAKRGYTRDTVAKLKGFALVEARSTPNARFLQHPILVPLLTIGTLLTIDAIKTSDIWLETSQWWLFFSLNL